MVNTILIGDVFECIDRIPDNYVDVVITSPPYWALRSYSDNEAELGKEPHFNDYLDKMMILFEKMKRIVKPQGSIWVNISDAYSTTKTGRPTRLNAGNSKTSGLVDKTLTGVPPKSQLLIPNRFAIRMVDELRYILRSTVIWHKPNPMPASVKDRFTPDFEYFFFFTKNYNYYFKQMLEPVKENTAKRHGWKGALTTERAMQRNKRCVWTIPTAASEVRRLDHSAQYPEKLVETPILACCPENGIVFDPFLGSGTTAVVAKKLNRNWLGCELNEEYARRAMIRISNTERGMF